MTTRRQFLAGLGAGAAAAAVPRIARADAPCTYKTLDVFVYGAFSHLDTFWVEQGTTSPWRERPDMSTVAAGVDDAEIPFLSQGQYGLPYALAVGAGFTPFLGTPLFDRMRLLALHTDLGVHPVAASIALTSAGIGQVSPGSLGAQVQSLFGASELPVSYVVDANRDAPVTRFATTTSLVASNRPFVIPMGSDTFITKLDRGGVVTDDLVDAARDRYAARLTHDAGRVRSNAFDVYNDSLDRSIGWAAVHGLLDDYPTLTAGDRFIGDAPNYTTNRLVRGIELAGYLFDNGARHVSVLGGGGTAHPTVDTHAIFPGPDYVGHATRQNGVLYGITQALRTIFDAGQIPLDRTLIRVWSEFGRRGDNLDGSEHWYQGYAGALIGGPITTRGVGGFLDFSSDDRGVSNGGFHPSEVNAAMAIAAGADPAQFGTPVETSAITTAVLGVDPTTLSCEIGIGL